MTIPTASSTRRIFLAAKQLPDEQARRIFVTHACGDDGELRSQVEQLLAVSQDEGESPIDHLVREQKILRDEPVFDLGDPYGTRLQATGIGDANADVSQQSMLDLSRHPMIGAYRLLEEIGRGGMGSVYMAQQTEPVKRKVAIKVINPGMDTREVIARFEAERQALAMMHHPHIAKVFDGGTTPEGRPYFVMELVRGLPIDRYCDEATSSLRDRLRLFIDVCRAVQHAHQKGIIHRDLKPSNILITLHDGIPVVKVIDFGIAKALNQKLTQLTLFTRITQLVGTPVYMSPEQAELSGLDIDTRSDVYSLGVLLYKLLVGVTPFDEQTLKIAGLDEMRRIIREDDPPRPSHQIKRLGEELVTTISDRRGTNPRQLTLSMKRELDWIVMKALEKDRMRRYDSASDLALDVQNYLQDEPVKACPPSATYLIQKWVRRHRWMVGMASTIALALIVTCAGSIWQVMQVRRAWQASLIRERRSNDLLEATQLQTAVTAFLKGDLATLASATTSLASATPSPTQQARSQGSLANLLNRAAKPMPQKFYPHSTAVYDLSVADDPSRMVSVDADGQLRIWDLTSRSGGKLLGSHGEPAHAVAISPDGKNAVSGSTTGNVWFWDLETGKITAKLHPTDSGIETLAWSPDGRSIAAGARYKSTWIFNTSGQTKLRVENDQRHESLLFSPDSRRLYVPTQQGIDVWDVESAERHASFTTTPIHNVRAMCWAGPNQEWLVAGERFSEKLVILHRESGKQLGTISAGVEYAQHLAASHDGDWLTAVYKGGHMRLIQLSESTTGEVDGSVQFNFDHAERTTDTPNEPRWTVQWLSNSNRFLSAGPDERVRLWDLDEIRSTRVLRDVSPSTTIRRVGAAYPLGATQLVYYVYEHTDAQDKPWRFDYFGNKLSPPGKSMTFAVQAQSTRAVGNVIALAGKNQIVMAELDSDRILGTVMSPHEHHWRVSLAADANVVAASTSDDQITVWRSRDQWATSEAIGTWNGQHNRAPTIADDGRTLIIENEDGTGIIEWDLQTGNAIQQYVGAAQPADFVVSPEGNLLAASLDAGIRVWDRRTGEIVFDVRTHSEATALNFSGEDRVLLSGHRDQAIRAWHLPTRQPLGVLFGPTEPLGTPTCLLPVEGENHLLALYDDGVSLQVVVLGPARRHEPLLAAE